MKGHTAAVWSPAFSPDGTRLATASSDGSIRIWDASTGSELRVLTGNGRGVAAVAWHPSLPQVAVSSWNRSSERGVWGTVNLWDTDTGQRVRQFEHGVKPIGSIAFNRDGSLLAVGTWDFDVAIWDTKTWDKKITLVPAKNDDYQAVRDLSFSPDGSRLAVAYADGRARSGTIKAWDVESLEPARAVWRLPQMPYSLALDPGDARAAMATWEGWIRILDVATGAELRSWRGHEVSGVDAAWSPDGKWIASTGNDGRVVLWEAATGTLIKELQDVEGQITSVAFSPDSAFAAAPDRVGAVHVWRVPSGELVATLKDGPAVTSVVAWGSDGTLASTAADGKVRLWNAERGTLRTSLDAAKTGTPIIAFDRTGQKLAIVAALSLRIWDVPGGRWLAELPPRSGAVMSLRYSADGSRLAAGLSANAFEVWDATTGDIMLRLPFTGQGTFSAWTRRDELILGPLDGTVRILRVRSELPSKGPASGDARMSVPGPIALSVRTLLLTRMSLRRYQCVSANPNARA